MAVITREELGLDRPDTAEQGSGHVTSRDYSGHVTFYRPPTPQEKVYDVVAEAGRAVTRGDIAKALGWKKTPWLTGIIEGLVSDGYLSRTHHVWKNGCLMYRYEVRNGA